MSDLPTTRHNDCEAVDACVFSGDMLADPKQRAEFKTYLDRWTRAYYKHEARAAEEAAPTGAQWMFSSMEEFFLGERYASQADALSAALNELGEDDPIFVGRVEPVNARQLIGGRVDHLIESISEAAEDRVGEAADDWPFLSKEDCDELGDLLSDFVLSKSPFSLCELEDVRAYTRAEAEAFVATPKLTKEDEARELARTSLMAEHVTSMDCWCKPQRDPEEPSVIVHNDASEAKGTQQ